MIVVVTALTAGFAAAVLLGGEPSAATRLAPLCRPAGTPGGDADGGRTGRGLPPGTLRVLVTVATGAGVAAVLGAGVGLVLALVAGVLVYRAFPRRLADLGPRQRDRAVAAAAPLACDLLAAVLAAGAPLVDAVRAVAAACTGPLAAVLNDVAAGLALGSPPEEAWAPAQRSPPLRPLASAAVRSAESGATLVAVLSGVADDMRDAAHADGLAAARLAGLRIVGPLTLCFLPAFAVLGVIPFVVGLFSGAIA